MNDEFMDIISLMSFCIGLQNLDENLTQDGVESMLNKTIDDVHNHLKEQDAKLDKIMEALYEKDR